MRQAFESGERDALSSFGLEKDAFFRAALNAVKAAPGQALNAVKAAPGQAASWVAARPAAMSKAVTSPDWWKGVGRDAAHQLVGNPKEVHQQVSNGTFFGPNGSGRAAMKPHGALDFALKYGLPAMSVYAATQAPPDQRGSAVGNMVGATLGGLAGSPLGALGNIGGSMLMGNLGSTIGSAFDEKPEAKQEAEQMISPQYRTLSRTSGLGV